MATSGPGATNLVTGIADAFMDSVPLVAVTGQVNQNMIGRGAFQETDVFGMTLPMVKHSYLVWDINDIPRIVKEAFFIAQTGRPGPVLLIRTFRPRARSRLSTFGSLGAAIRFARLRTSRSEPRGLMNTPKAVLLWRGVT
jgi:hypothetical protein